MPSAIHDLVGKKMEQDMLDQFQNGKKIQQQLRKGRRAGLGSN